MSTERKMSQDLEYSRRIMRVIRDQMNLVAKEPDSKERAVKLTLISTLLDNLVAEFDREMLKFSQENSTQAVIQNG